MPAFKAIIIEHGYTTSRCDEWTPPDNIRWQLKRLAAMRKRRFFPVTSVPQRKT